MNYTIPRVLLISKKYVNVFSVSGILVISGSVTYFPERYVSEKTEHPTEIHKIVRSSLFRKFTLFLYSLRSVATCKYL